MVKKYFLIQYIQIATTLVLLMLLILIEALVLENIAILILGMAFIALGILFTLLVYRNHDSRNALYIFLLFFLLYLIYTSLVHFGMLYFYDVPNIAPDEHHFYLSSNEIALKVNSEYGFFDMAETVAYRDTVAFVYWNGLIAKFANMYAENSVFIQKISVALVGSLIPMLMYGVSRIYFSSKDSFSIAIVYGLFSFVPYLSSLLLRDIHIALMFILTIYIILEKFSFLNFIILLCAMFVSYYLRPQTGVFMMGFTLIYLFIFIRNIPLSNAIKVFIYSTFIGITIIAVLNSPLMEMFTQISESSAQRGVAATSSSSLGATLGKLPFGLNVVAKFSFSQIQPFPPSWIFKGINRGFFELTYLIAGIAWFFGWGFLLYGLFVEKILKNKDLKLIIMFFFALVYLVLISIIEFNQRRQMAVYPIVYLCMVFSYLAIDKSIRTKLWIGLGTLYISLVLLLNYIKL